MMSPSSSPGNRRDRVAEAHHQFSELYGGYHLARICLISLMEPTLSSELLPLKLVHNDNDN